MVNLDQNISKVLQEKYERVKNLLEKESRNDPESEPYKSKYAARSLLEEMKNTLLSVLDEINNTDSDYEHVESMFCAVLLLIGTVSVDTEELSKGEENLNLGLERINDIAIKPKAVLVTLAILNQLGLLWSQRGDSKKSHEFLQKAEQVYLDFKCLSDEKPVEISELFGVACIDEKDQNSLEKMHTLTLYYLAQVHGTMSNPVKSAVYCHTTLKRQLDSKDFDPVEWALNSATLAQFFMERNVFHEGRHHLAAASFILDQHEESLCQEKCNEEEMEAKKERLRHRAADVARCWAKYGLMLLSASKDRLMESGEDDSPPNSEQIGKLPDELVGLKFSALEVTLYEGVVTDSYVLTYDDARTVFLNSQQWLNKASEFYTLEDHASDNVQIVQDMSQLYKGLVFFEDDEERQAKMHKRRVDILQAVVKELNPTYYLSACRQIWFELGEIHSAILDIKLSRLQSSSEVPAPHSLQKINRLSEQAIEAYNQFLDSLRDPKSKETPKIFTSDLERPALLAYFYLGRLYNKLITADKATKVTNYKNSINYFQMVVDYCERNESAKEQISAELGVCKDMANLMPLKLTKLTEAMKT